MILIFDRFKKRFTSGFIEFIKSFIYSRNVEPSPLKAVYFKQLSPSLRKGESEKMFESTV